MVKLTMVSIEGSATEVADVGARLGVSFGGGAQVTSAPVAATAEAPKRASVKDTPPETGEPAKPGRRRRSRKDKAAAEAPPPEPSQSAASDDKDEAKTSKRGNGAGVITAAELQDAKRLHHIVDRIMEKGIEDEDEIVAICEDLKGEVSLLGRVKDLSKRVRAAIEVARS